MTTLPIKTDSLADLAKRINTEHAAVVRAFRRGIERALACGNLLCEAKMRYGRHGKWAGWLAKHCPNISQRTAQQYMRIAAHADEIKAKCETVSHLAINEALDLIAERAIAPPTYTVPVEVTHKTLVITTPYASVEAKPPQPTTFKSVSYVPPAGRAITTGELADIATRQAAADVIESLLRLGRAADRCDLGAMVEVLLNDADKLDRVRRGISFAIRIKGALDQAGVRGNPHLKLIESGTPPPVKA